MRRTRHIFRWAWRLAGTLLVVVGFASCKNPVGSFDLGGTTTPPAVATVTIRSSGFDPILVSLRPGGRLTFDNRDSAAHQIVSTCSELNTSSLAPGSRTTVQMRSVVTTCYYHDQTNSSLTGTVQTCNEIGLFTCR